MCVLMVQAWSDWTVGGDGHGVASCTHCPPLRYRRTVSPLKAGALEMGRGPDALREAEVKARAGSPLQGELPRKGEKPSKFLPSFHLRGKEKLTSAVPPRRRAPKDKDPGPGACIPLAICQPRKRLGCSLLFPVKTDPYSATVFCSLLQQVVD